MPDFDDLPFDDVTRAASAAAEEPDFAVLATRGVRRRRQRRAGTAGAAAVVLLGALGAVQLTGGDGDSAPDPAPDVPRGLVFTRGDDSAFTPSKLTVGCQRVEGVTLLIVSGPFTDVAPTDPERSEQTISGHVGIQMPIDNVRDGAELTLPDQAGRPAASLFAADPATDDRWDSRAPDSSVLLRVESARCGAVPAIAFEVDGVLGSRLSDATVEVRGRVALEGEKPPENLAAAEIVDDPDSRFVALAVSDDDPDRRATVWQQCTGSAGCESRYAIVVTGDGFEHRTVLPKVFLDYPLVAPAGDGFHLQAGLGAGTLVGPNGSLQEVRMRDEPVPGAAGPVFSIGSGQRVWVAIDPETATAAVVPGAEQFQQLWRQSDGSLAGITNSGDYGWSVDGGTHWSERKLDGGPNALYQVVPTDGSQQVVLEGADGATVFPFVAVHRARSAGGVAFERLTAPGDPRPYVAGPVVLPDGRLMVVVESWSDQRPGGDHVTMPGLYVSEGSDWTNLQQVDVGAPYDELRIFQPSFLGTKVSEAGATIYLQAPPGEPADAYRSDDGGLTWQPVPAR